MPFDTPFDTRDFSTITSDLLQTLASGTGGRPVLTDNTEGSVVRTLSEAFARELAMCYQQLIKIYQYGYLDTADGDALDNVVALLGISRQQAGHIEGSVSFSRSQPATDDIPVPAGTLLAGRDIPVFETTQDTFLLKGQLEVTTTIRSQEPGTQTVKAGAIKLMPRPIWGIENVTNHADLLLHQLEETDDDLRERTRHVLQKANLGTSLAIEQAVRSLGIAQVSIQENSLTPGVVNVILGDSDISDDLLNQAIAAVQEARPAGIRVNVSRSNRVIVQIAATLVLRDDYPQEKKKTISDQITLSLQNYFNSLKNGELVRISTINSILTHSSEIAEIQLPAQTNTSVLHPFLLNNGVLTDVGSSYRLNNGDIRIDASERATLDLGLLPLLITLEPPTLDIWVDVNLTLYPAQNPLPEQSIHDALQPRLDTFKPGQIITYENLVDALGQNSFKSFSFNLIHSSDNLAVKLCKTSDNDLLKIREQLRVGHIVFIKDVQNG